MPSISIRFVPAALAASLVLMSLPALAGNGGPGAGHGSVSGGVSGFSGSAGHGAAGLGAGGLGAAGHGAQGFAGHDPGGHGMSGHGIAAGWSRGAGQGWHGQGWHGQGWHGQGWHGQGWHGQGWHGGFGRLSGMVSDGNSTQTPYAPPAIYRVEADGNWRRHQARHRGRMQGRPGPGIYAVGGSEPVFAPNVLVVRVPRG